MHVDEHIGLEATCVPIPHTDAEMREMFLGAIKIQEEIVQHAQSMIQHYEYALSEMAAQELVA